MGALDDIKALTPDGKNPNWVKRRAKKIRDEQGIRYTQALLIVEQQIEAELEEQFNAPEEPYDP